MHLECVADIDEPRSTGDIENPLAQLCFCEHRSTAVWNIGADEVGRKLSPETAKLCEVLLVGTDDAEMSSAVLPGTCSHFSQLGGLILLGDALWHGRQIFGVDPVTLRVLGKKIEVFLIFTGMTRDRERIWSLLVSGISVSTETIPFTASV